MRNKSSRYMYLLLAALILAAAWSALDFFGLTESGRRAVIAVLVEDSESDRWTQLRLGLAQAEKEYDIQIRCMQTGTYQNVQDQLEVARNEAKYGTDAILLVPVGSTGTQEVLSELAFSRMVILGETDAIKDSSEGSQIAVVQPDHAAMADALADMALREGKRPQSIGILAGNQDQEGTQIRLQTVRERMEKERIVLQWTLPRSPETADALSEAAAGALPDMILALDDEALRAAADWKQETGAGTALYGIGSSATLAWLMDRGIVGGVIVPDEYGLGYRSAAMLAERLESRTSSLQDMTIGFTEVTTSNMYDDNIARLLFPEIE